MKMKPICTWLILHGWLAVIYELIIIDINEIFRLLRLIRVKDVWAGEAVHDDAAIIHTCTSRSPLVGPYCCCRHGGSGLRGNICVHIWPIISIGEWYYPKWIQVWRVTLFSASDFGIVYFLWSTNPTGQSAEPSLYPQDKPHNEEHAPIVSAFFIY